MPEHLPMCEIVRQLRGGKLLYTPFMYESGLVVFQCDVCKRDFTPSDFSVKELKNLENLVDQTMEKIKWEEIHH